MSTSKNKDGNIFENKFEIFRFMLTSPAKLIDNLPKEDFKRFYKESQLLRKGVFPYDRFDSFEKLKENQLPPKEAFHSKLYDTDITDEDYYHAKKVWETFRMKTLYRTTTTNTSSQTFFY